MSVPFLFIFDLDHTMVGNADTSIFLRELCEAVHGISNKKCVGVSNLITKIIRPYLVQLLQFLYGCKDVEIMVYSHGTDDYVRWAVPIIEKHAGIKFRRPILSRSHTVPNQFNHIKSIDLAVSNLIPKYPELRNPKVFEKMVNKRTVLIDDRGPIVAVKDGNRVLQVKQYSRRFESNAIQMFPKEAREFARRMIVENYGASSLLLLHSSSYSSCDDTVMRDLLIAFKKIVKTKSLTSKMILKLSTFT